MTVQGALLSCVGISMLIVGGCGLKDDGMTVEAPQSPALGGRQNDVDEQGTYRINPDAGSQSPHGDDVFQPGMPDAGTEPPVGFGNEDAVDGFGVKKIYPSRPNGESWAMNMNNATSDTRFDPKSSIQRNSDGSWKMRSNQVRMNVFTSTGYQPSKIRSYDPDVLAQQGYMQSPNDWRNIEMTGYVKVNSGSGDNFAWYGRGGKHNDDNGGCEGTAYKGDLYFSGGRVRVAKESWHNEGYDFSDDGGGAPSPKSGWVGFKTIIFNVQRGGKTVVKVELYTAPNQDKTNWKRVFSFEDDGNWRGQMSKCGGSNSRMPISWGGPIATFRWDSASDVDFKWLSVREIQPPGNQ